jgi:hypothetical protein
MSTETSRFPSGELRASDADRVAVSHGGFGWLIPVFIVLVVVRRIAGHRQPPASLDPAPPRAGQEADPEPPRGWPGTLCVFSGAIRR